MSESILTGTRVVCGLPSAPVLVTAERNFPGCSIEKFLKNTTARSAAFGWGIVGLSLMNWATTAGCAFAQLSTYAPFFESALTHACARELCWSAHWATICGLPW